MDFKFIILLQLFFASLAAFAEGDRNPIDSSTAKSLGMGNAGINSERGPHSVFYNPANIAAKNTGSMVQLTNISLEGNEGLVTQSQKGGSLNIYNLPTFYQTVKSNANSFEGTRLSLYPNATFRNFSLGFLAELNRGAMFRETDSALYVKARDRIGPIGALSYRLFSGVFRIGVMVQLLSVTEADKYITPAAVSEGLSWDKHLKTGMSITKTAGLTLTLPFRYLPSFSLVARDIGGTSYARDAMFFKGTGTPTPKKMSYDFGSSITYYLGKSIESIFEFDYVDIKNNTKSNKIQRMRLGGEVKLFNLLYFRGGYLNGWPTGGFGIGTKKASLNFAWYSDNIEDRVRGYRDQRYVLQYVNSIFGGK